MKTKFNSKQSLNAAIVFLTTLSFTCAMIVTSPAASTAQTVMLSKEIRSLILGIKTKSKGGKKSPLPAEQPHLTMSTEGFIRHITAPADQYFPVTNVVKGDFKKTAYNFIKEHQTLLGTVSPKGDFKSIKSHRRHNRNFERFEQTYSGLPIFGAQIIIQMNDIGGVEHVTSDIARNLQQLDTGKFSVSPKISANQAAITARSIFLKNYPKTIFKTTQPELKIFDPSVLGGTGKTHLVWDVTVYSKEALVGGHLLIDGHNGKIVRRYPLNKSYMYREVYDGQNIEGASGLLVRAEGDPVYGVRDVDDAYDFLEDTYNFYLNEHGRDSIDGAGAKKLIAVVRYCPTGYPCPWQNANWVGHWGSFGIDTMYFGYGFATDDVVAHEYTHGVTEFTSNLVYANESGAINESFSDIWGEFVDQTNGAGTDDMNALWKIGEDIFLYSEYDPAIAPRETVCGNGIDDDGDSFIDDGCQGNCTDGIDNDGDGDIDGSDTNCHMRNMSDPTTKKHPDKMSSSYFIPYNPNPDDTNDYGGVHTNSGVGNKLAYLLSDGDTFNSQSVTGMGISRVADLYYLVNTSLLTSGADYADLGDALETASLLLIWSSQERNNLYRALLAVEIASARSNIYVDKNSTSPIEDGSIVNPFKTVSAAHAYAKPGDNIFIFAGTYNETLTLDKIMEIKVFTPGTTVTIGP